MVRKIALTVGIALTVAPAFADAQIVPPEHRTVVFADFGVARTVAPESLIGDGPSVSGGFGFRLTPGKTIQGLVHYVSYYRNDEGVTFDGRVIFYGAEIAFQSNRPRVRPFVTVGPGILDVRDIVIRKRQITPTLRVSDPPIARDLTLIGMTAWGGIDIRIAEQLSLRVGARFHGVLDRQVGPDDSLPFMIFRPGIGAMWRW